MYLVQFYFLTWVGFQKCSPSNNKAVYFRFSVSVLNFIIKKGFEKNIH